MAYAETCETGRNPMHDDGTGRHLSGCVCPGMQPRRIGINAWADRLRMTRLLPQVQACIMTARLRFHMKRIDV